MTTSDPNSKKLEFTQERRDERKDVSPKTDEFALLLEKYVAVERELTKELEYGRLVRGRIKRLDAELAKEKLTRTRFEEMVRRQKIRIESLEKRAINLHNKMEHTRNTLSFRLGYSLIHGFKSWGNFFNLPSTILALRKEAVAKRSQTYNTGGSEKKTHVDVNIRDSSLKKNDVVVESTDAIDKNRNFNSNNSDSENRFSTNGLIESSNSHSALENQSLSVEPSFHTNQNDSVQAEMLAGSKSGLANQATSNTAITASDVPERKQDHALDNLDVKSDSDFARMEKTSNELNRQIQVRQKVAQSNEEYLASLVHNLKDMRIACIMDEFTYHSFKDECTLTQLRPESWKAELEEINPDLLFIESSWKGVDELWARKISDISNEAIDLVDFCKQKKIPIVFWNKEDPFHFGRFLPIAKRADVVFTTDVDCIEKYKFEVGHNRVFLLPFAAQPTSHNPIETFERKDAFSFAGSFYLRYPERQRDFDNIYDVGQELRSVDIFDRNFENPHPHLKFPEKYDASILGSLPVAEIDKAYKGYKFGINMNTIKYSQTMFARRVYELLASNTVVVSNFSRGLRTLFGDLVVSSDAKSELYSRLKKLCEDESYYRKFRLLGLRKIMSGHTYSHRLVFILSKITSKSLSLPDPEVAVIAYPKSIDDYKRTIENFDRQLYQSKSLYIVSDDSKIINQTDETAIHVVDDHQALCAHLASLDVKYVVPMHYEDYYGPNYLTDLALSVRYGKFDAVGKSAYYNAEQKGAVSLVNDGKQYHVSSHLPIRASMISMSAFQNLNISSSEVVRDDILSYEKMLAIDEFNYCQNAYVQTLSHVSSIVDDLPLHNQGLDLEHTVYKIVDSIKPSNRGLVADSAEKLPGISAKELFSYLPKKIANTLKFKIVGSQLSIKSSLNSDQHKYIYLTKIFTKEELNFETNNRFQLLCDGNIEGDFRTIYVFLDEKGEKIEHAMNKVGAAYSITIPKNCQSIKLGFRFQGAGQSIVERLILGDLREKPSVLLTNSENLVLTKQYPEYSDLYRYGFLHSRIKEYKTQNLDFEVFKISEHVNIEYREFEGIDVLSSDYQFLDNLLQQNAIKKIIVHFIDEKIWNVLKKYTDKLNIYIWVHGAEIQPWFRRAVRFDTPSALQKAKKASDVAQQMWLEIFEKMSEKLQLIFVSDYLSNEVQNDFGCRLNPNFYSVIPNFVDGQFFTYTPKEAQSRTRILSIRPYASMIYGNDLSVRAVELLSQEPFFNELEFKFVGDGSIFEDTLDPIKNFANVKLQKGFVTQKEIASLHKEYGIFLVPSRMDTQGVSRDEAMSSGLVPVTNRVAAIPDFVDNSCAIMASPENAYQLAQGIKDLYLNPHKFLTMSTAASEHVRSISSYNHTIKREIDLIKHGIVGTKAIESNSIDRINIALYGDVNLNLTDGSAIWAISLAQTLAEISNVYVTVFLKCRVSNTHIISPLLNMSKKIRIVEPKVEGNASLTPQQALQSIELEESFTSFDGVVLRGLELCNQATFFPSLEEKVWAYITDLPQQRYAFNDDTLAKVGKIFSFSKYVLCQTPQFKEFIEDVFPQVAGKTKILSPMIPALVPDNLLSKDKFEEDGVLRIVYAGKFAPLWGIREMFQVFKELKESYPKVELHVFGDKIHNPPGDPKFKPEILEYLKNLDGVIWYSAVTRDKVIESLPSMHIGWAYRDPNFEQSTRELSTKVLEYASMGLPVLLSKNDINEEVFGENYPLFASNEKDAIEILARYCREKGSLKSVSSQVRSVSEGFTFDAVRKSLVDQDIFK